MVAISATSRRSQSSLSLSQWPRAQGAIEGGMQRGNRGKLLHSLLEGTGERRDGCDDHGQRGIDIQGYETLAREVGRQFGTRPLGRRRESRGERGSGPAAFGHALDRWLGKPTFGGRRRSKHFSSHRRPLVGLSSTLSKRAARNDRVSIIFTSGANRITMRRNRLEKMGFSVFIRSHAFTQ